MTMSVHVRALVYLQIAPACLKKGCLLIARPLARAGRFNTTQMAPVGLFTPWKAIHLSPPALLPIPAFPWPRDTGVTTPLGPCSAPLVPGSLCGGSGGALAMCLARHAARQQRGPFISPLLLSVCPELAVSYVPSAKRLARLALSSTVGPNWKCMLLYNPFYWHLLSPWNSSIVIIYSVLLLHGKMDFHLPLIFSVLFLKKSKEITSMFKMHIKTIYFIFVTELPKVHTLCFPMVSIKYQISVKNPVDRGHISSCCKLAKLCWSQ